MSGEAVTAAIVAALVTGAFTLFAAVLAAVVMWRSRSPNGAPAAARDLDTLKAGEMSTAYWQQEYRALHEAHASITEQLGKLNRRAEHAETTQQAILSELRRIRGVERPVERSAL